MCGYRIVWYHVHSNFISLKGEGYMRKTVTWILAAAMVFTLGGGSVSAEESKVTATGTALGIDGAVVVQVEADAETIYSVEVLEQNETPGIGSVAVEQLPGPIV